MGISEKTTYDIEQDLIRTAATSVIEDAATAVTARHRIIQFRGNVMIKVQEPYAHFVPMGKETFERITYPLAGGMTKSRMNDTFAYLCSTADDLTDNDRYILFGAGTTSPAVWDMETLEIRTDIYPDDCVWRSPYPVESVHDDRPIPFILFLAGGSTELYSDIIQSLAPLLMSRKPDGVIWWIGDDVNGKNTLMDAISKVFPDQLSSLSVKQLVGGRSNTTRLNGVLGNVAEDSGQITDTEIYKSIGAHQNFNVHRYHSQNGVEVQGNVHHIFSATGSPKFYTRSLQADWRTHVIQFSDRPDSGRADTLTDDFGRLIAEMCRHAVRIKQRGYRYNWLAAAPVTIDDKTRKLITA